MRPAVFPRESALHFQFADLFVELGFLAIGMLEYPPAAVANVSGKPTGAFFFEPPTWVGWTPNICAIWAAALRAVMAFTANLALRLGG
jgi:hypothetical protein